MVRPGPWEANRQWAAAFFHPFGFELTGKSVAGSDSGRGALIAGLSGIRGRVALKQALYGAPRA